MEISNNLMKTLRFVCMLPLVLLLQACPVGLDYSLADKHQVPIDARLLGEWESDNPSGEIQSIVFKANNSMSLHATVLEPGDSYALEEVDFTVWQTELEGKTFLVFKPDVEDKFYHYGVEMDDREIVFYDMSLLNGGTDAVNSSESLRKEVASSIYMEGWAAEKTRLFKK